MISVYSCVAVSCFYLTRQYTNTAFTTVQIQYTLYTPKQTNKQTNDQKNKNKTKNKKQKQNKTKQKKKNPPPYPKVKNLV